MKALSIAIIGCGKAASRHLKIYNQIEWVNVMAVADEVEEKARAFAEEAEAEAFANWQDMLERHPEVNVVDISVPSGLHAEIGLPIMKKFKKHILMEKPIALLLDEAEELVKTAEELNLKLVTIYQNRFNLPIKLVRNALNAGWLGNPILVSARFYWCRHQSYYDSSPWRGTWAYDGGVLAQQGAHHMDMLCWLGGEVESVYAQMATRLAEIEAEDILVGVVKFKNGALGTVEATTCARPSDIGAELTILGEKGHARVGGFAMNELISIASEERDFPNEEIEAFKKNPEDPLGYSHRAYIEAALRYFAGEEPDEKLCIGKDALSSVQLIQALYESAERGEPVKLPFSPQKSKLGRR